MDQPPVTNQDGLTRSFLVALAVFAFFSLGCINLFGPDSVPRPDLSGLECGQFEGDVPRMGYLWDDYEPMSSECADVPIEPGFQGGFHIQPAIWLPIDMQTGDLTGIGTARVTFINGELEPMESTFEVYRDFWRPVDNGSAVDRRVILPNDLVEDGGRWDVQIDLEIEFDDPNQQAVSVSETTQIYLDL